MKLYSIILLCLFFLPKTHAQTLSAERSVDWSVVGFQGCIPNPSTVRQITDYGGNGNGTTNNSIALTNAINSLLGEAGVIYFPAGNYLFNNTVTLPSGIVIRGESASNTTFTFDLGGAFDMSCFQVGSVPNNAFVALLSGYNKSSFSVETADASSFSIGDWVEIRQVNGSWDISPQPWATYCVGQIVKITEKVGNILTLNHALRIDYSAALLPEIRQFVPTQNIGIESIKIIRTDSPATGGGSAINFHYATNCWIRDVESQRSIGSHILTEACSNIDISGCYFHEAIAYDGSSTRGYGITFTQHTGECRVVNCIFRSLRHAMSLKQGANGNVFAYNYSREVIRTEFPSDYATDISLHGHYPFANLFEGNVVQNIGIDYTFGPAGPYNTFFRNRTERYGLGITGGSPSSDNQNFIGNEIVGTFPYGNFSITASSGNFSYGNNINGTISPNGTNTLAEQTLCYTAPPSFWSEPAWSSIGIPSVLNTGTIPAKNRWSTAIKTFKLPAIAITNGTGMATLTASIANSYQWSQGASSQSIVANSVGVYSINASYSDGCSTNWVNIVANNLPIRLLYFRGLYQEKQNIILRWATAEQRQSLFFTIERSLNAIDFVPIARLDAAGNSDEIKTYFFEDNNLPQNASIVYYRLAEVDQQGKTSILPVIGVQVSFKEYMVFPNPASNSEFWIQSPDVIESVELSDILGKKVRIQNIILNDNMLKINVLEQAIGLFLLHIKTANQTIHKQVFIQR